MHVGYVAKAVVFKVRLVSGFRGHLLGRLWGGKVFYSRVGVPVVYPPKNLLHGLAFSNFACNYYTGHYKMSPST